MGIAEVLKDQRQELDEGLRKLSLVPREAEKQLPAKSQRILVVSGVRRCGKSVLISRLLQGKEFGYANFDDDRLAAVEPNEVLSGLYQIHGRQLETIFLDEIQNLERWELFVNRLHRAGFRIFLTGSNAKLLARELATHLTGRHHTLELFPFSFREFLTAKGFHEDVATTRGRSIAAQHLQGYLAIGGFPEVVTGREDPVPYVRQLCRQIIERDIIGRYTVAHKKTFREMAGSILGNPARRRSYGKLRRQFGLGSNHTVKNYLSYLEEAYLVLLLGKHSFKPVEAETGERKGYGIDTGMIAALSMQGSRDQGPLYENAVALELFRQRAASPLLELSYWKSPEQEEVDFVLRHGKTFTQLIQVCTDPSDETTRKRELRALVKAGGELRCESLMVITEQTERQETVSLAGKKRTVRFVPLWKWLLQQG